MLGKAAYFLHLSVALFVKYLLPGKAAHYLHLSVAFAETKAAHYLHLSVALFVEYLLPGKAAHYLHLSVALFMAPSQAIHHHPPVAEPLINQLL